jgi:retron-type reverse transcriptase
MGADIVINADLKDFFPTISFHRVEGLFKSVGYSPAVATIMALLCTECPRETVKFNGTVYHVATGQRSLPQGACTSPAISNLIAKHFDLRLAGMAEKLGWTYTRYADDITYSAKTPGVDASEANSKTGYVLARLRHIADDEGFVINEKKTRVLRNHTRQSVTGVVVNDRVGVARPTVRKLRAILHNAKKTGLESQNRDGKENFGAWLNGMISYVEMVNNKQGAKLRKSFDEVLNSG